MQTQEEVKYRSAISQAEALAKYKHKIPNLQSIPLNDMATLKFLAKGKNFEGLFQIKNYNARKLCVDLITEFIRKCEKIGYVDPVKTQKLISDINTLIRPSSINAGSLDRYKRRYLGEDVISPIEGNHFQQMFEDYTKTTQKELLYQEHFMLILDELFCLQNLGIADEYRRIFEKKDTVKLEDLKEKFWDIYCDSVSVEDCKQFWEFLVLCGGYGFNMSHSIGYAIVSYYTAFLKVHCTKYFIATCINDCKTDAKMKKEQKIAAFVHDSEQMSIKVFPPRLNHCFDKTVADKEADIIYLSVDLYVGLGNAITKYLSQKNDHTSIEAFIEWSRGIYTYSQNEVGKEHKTRVFNKGVYEILVRMRFFDNIEPDVNKVARIFNEYICKSEPQFRQKTFFKTFEGNKKFNAYAYKLKQNEKLVADYSQVCRVIVEEPLLTDKITIEKSQFWYENFYLRFTLSDYVGRYNKKLQPYELVYMGYVLVEEVKHGKKGDYKYSNVTVKWCEQQRENPEVVHLSKVHCSYQKGDILQLIFEDGEKFRVRNYEKIDSL